MTISYPLAFPTNRNPMGMVLRAKKVVSANFAPGSLVPQVYEWSGERWEIDFSFNLMERSVGAPWVAWLTSLRGPVGSFLAGDPTGTTPLGTASVAPTVSSTTAALSRTLPVSGGTGSLLAGSMISIGSGSTRRLYQVQEDAASLASATLSIWPALRTQATSGTAVAITNATGLFMLMPGKPPEWSLDVKGYYRISGFTAVEDLR